MCSRYTNKVDLAVIERQQRELGVEHGLKIEYYGGVPRITIGCDDLAPINILDSNNAGKTRSEGMRWGWRVAGQSAPIIHAKGESILSNNTFRPYLQNRCLIIADGFFAENVFFHNPRHFLMSFAGIYREEKDDLRFVMLTTTANDTVRPFSRRMPFVLQYIDFATWLSADWKDVLKSPNQDALERMLIDPKQPSINPERGHETN